MKLTEAERLILFNQYEILSKLDDSAKEHCELLIECLTSGYDRDFEQLVPHFESAQSQHVYQQVRDILQMFRALSNAAGPDKHPAARFAGFDGNEETAHYAYARFLLEDRGLWKESQSNNLNTHSPVLSDYLAMLEVWNEAKEKFELSPEEIKAIVELAPYASTHS